MKKIFFGFVFSCLIFFSCSKVYAQDNGDFSITFSPSSLSSYTLNQNQTIAVTLKKHITMAKITYSLPSGMSWVTDGTDGNNCNAYTGSFEFSDQPLETPCTFNIVVKFNAYQTYNFSLQPKNSFNNPVGSGAMSFDYLVANPPTPTPTNTPTPTPTATPIPTNTPTPTPNPLVYGSGASGDQYGINGSTGTAVNGTVLGFTTAANNKLANVVGLAALLLITIAVVYFTIKHFRSIGFSGASFSSPVPWKPSKDFQRSANKGFKK